MSLNVAIIGPGRSRQGTGPYVARSFSDLGASIRGVVSSSPASAEQAAGILKSEFGIETGCYPGIEELIDSEPVDVIAICSPINSHREYLEKAINAGTHIFCEKPLWWPARNGPQEFDSKTIWSDTKSLIERCNAQGLFLHVNTQWPFTLPTFYEIFSVAEPGAESIESFAMWLSPTGSGKSMIVDSVPHLLSMIYALVGTGRIEKIELQFEPHERAGEIDINFDYLHDMGKTKVSLCLRSSSEMPKPAAFAINGLRVDRCVEIKDYLISLRSSHLELPVPDPLVSSISHFLRSIREGNSMDEVSLIEGMTHLAEIYQAANSN